MTEVVASQIEPWIKAYWRPAVAWQYFTVCVFDFIIFPSASMYYLQQPWDPITLKEGGFYHLSMAAIIGVAAWTRGQEKIRRILMDEQTDYNYTEQVEAETTVTTQTPLQKKKRSNRS